MILPQPNLFYAVTPDSEMYPKFSITSTSFVLLLAPDCFTGNGNQCLRHQPNFIFTTIFKRLYQL